MKPTVISRRKFVKVAAGGTAAFTILPSHTISGLGHIVPSDKLHIAAVGCGGEAAVEPTRGGRPAGPTPKVVHPARDNSVLAADQIVPQLPRWWEALSVSAWGFGPRRSASPSLSAA